MQHIFEKILNEGLISQNNKKNLYMQYTQILITLQKPSAILEYVHNKHQKFLPSTLSISPHTHGEKQSAKTAAAYCIISDQHWHTFKRINHI